MKYLFIDDFKFEIRQGKRKGQYFGLAFVLLDASKYNKLKNGFDSFLKKAAWPRDTEFKGRYFFDGKGLKGNSQELWKQCHDNIRKNLRIYFDREIFSGTNKKLRLLYVYMKGEKSPENYKAVLLSGVQKMLVKKLVGRSDKNYCSVFADSETNLKTTDFKGVFDLLETKAIIFEGNLNFVVSSNYSPGIQLADIFAYFASWYLTDDKDIRLDDSLFDTENQKLKKETMRLIEDFLNDASPEQVEISV